MNYRSSFMAALIIAWAAAASAQTQETAAGAPQDTALAATVGEVNATKDLPPREIYSSSIFISEFNVLVPIAGAAQANQDAGFAFGPELGWMQSVGPRTGIGAALYTLVGNTPQLGVKLKYRRWLSRRFSIDAGLGTVIATGSESRSGQYVGSLGLSWNDRLHFVLHYENFRITEVRYGSPYSGWRQTEDTHRASALYAGVKVGRKLGLVATSAMAVGTVIFAIAIANSDWSMP